MNLLFVEDEEYSFIYKEFEKSGHMCIYAERPYGSDEEYLTYLMTTIAGNNIGAVVSLSFYKFISLACNISQIPYICWLIRGYDPINFDYTIRNELNYIFCADIDTYEVLRAGGVKNVEYMPLCPTITKDDGKQPTKDVLFWAEDIQELQSVSLQMDLLKDATKGYLDGVLNSKKADLRQKEIFNNLAIYVREEIEKNYPMEDEDLESLAHKYDYQMLLPMLEYKPEHIMLYHLSAAWNKAVYGIDVLTKNADVHRFDNDRLSYYDYSSFVNSKDKSPDDYRIVIFFPGFAKSSMLTIDMINVMMSNSLLICPGYMDDRILRESGAVFFRNRYELDRHINHYLEDESARRQKVAECRGMICNDGESYRDRLDHIINRIE